MKERQKCTRNAKEKARAQGKYFSSLLGGLWWEWADLVSLDHLRLRRCGVQSVHALTIEWELVCIAELRIELVEQQLEVGPSG